MGKFSLIEWEKVLGDINEYPSYEELDCFLATRIRTLEALQNAKDNLKTSKSTQNQASTASTFSMNALNVKCVLCNGKHLFSCDSFKQLSTVHRKEIVKEKHLCFNCLKSGHSSKTCRNKKLLSL